MADFTVVTEQGWFSRIGGSIKGIIFGLILFVVAFPVLFWNEGRAVERDRALKEGGEAVQQAQAGEVAAAQEGALVHLSGLATTDETLADEEFGISQNAVKLQRSVSMYQWDEEERTTTKKKMGGKEVTTKEYDYRQTWAERVIDSDQFADPKARTERRNPKSMPFPAKTAQAKNVTLGAFKMSGALVSAMSRFEDLAVDASSATIPASVQDKARFHQGGVYVGADPANPQIGDAKVSFSVSRPAEVSILARQTGDTFTEWTSPKGRTLEQRLQYGIHTSEAMIQKAKDENKMVTWILRAVGFFMMVIGISTILKPLSVLGDVVPLIGSIIGVGIGIIAFVISLACSLITIALAWLVYRPLLGVPLLIGGIALLIVPKIMAKKKAA